MDAVYLIKNRAQTKLRSSRTIALARDEIAPVDPLDYMDLGPG